MYHMPDIPSNTVYVNINKCYTIKWNITGSYTKPLSVVKCSEVVLLNNTGHDIYFKAGDGTLGNPADITEFLIEDGQEFTVQGLTNSEQLSCTGLSGVLYGRAQYYSSTPQTRQ